MYTSCGVSGWHANGHAVERIEAYSAPRAHSATLVLKPLSPLVAYHFLTCGFTALARLVIVDCERALAEPST